MASGVVIFVNIGASGPIFLRILTYRHGFLHTRVVGFEHDVSHATGRHCPAHAQPFTEIMILGLFQREPLLDDTTADWIHAVFSWALREQGREVFLNGTDLVLPTSEFFPGRADNAYAMAQMIFESVRRHAGLNHWPCRLLSPGELAPQPYPPQVPPTPKRVMGDASLPTAPRGTPALVRYAPELVGNPEALIASYAQAFAHHLAASASEPPPAGDENWGHVTELLGVFMGFGIMLANTAFNVRVNSCGSCQGPVAERTGFLGRAEIAYALALFCRLKGIPARHAKTHLSSALRTYFRRALQDVDRKPDLLSRFRDGMPAFTDPSLSGGFSKPF
jgi:hypothetical protein